MWSCAECCVRAVTVLFCFGWLGGPARVCRLVTCASVCYRLGQGRLAWCWVLRPDTCTVLHSLAKVRLQRGVHTRTANSAALVQPSHETDFYGAATPPPCLVHYGKRIGACGRKGWCAVRLRLPT